MAKKEVSIIGVDLVKQVVQLHGTTAEGEIVFREEKLSRKQFLAFTPSPPGCVVAIEFYATARHRAWTLTAIRHDMRLIAPKFVKPYVKSQKTTWRMPKPSRKLAAGRPCYASRCPRNSRGSA